MNTFNSIWCLLFLLLPSLPHFSNQVVNWALVAACAMTFWLMMPFDETYKRLSLDKSGLAAKPKQRKIKQQKYTLIVDTDP